MAYFGWDFLQTFSRIHFQSKTADDLPFGITDQVSRRSNVPAVGIGDPQEGRDDEENTLLLVRQPHGVSVGSDDQRDAVEVAYRGVPLRDSGNGARGLDGAIADSDRVRREIDDFHAGISWLVGWCAHCRLCAALYHSEGHPGTSSVIAHPSVVSNGSSPVPIRVGGLDWSRVHDLPSLRSARFSDGGHFGDLARVGLKDG